VTSKSHTPTNRGARSGRSLTSGVLILGMHRSGTSLAARMLNLLGLHTCIGDDLLGPTRRSPSGLWESDSLVKMNDGLLQRVGRAWWWPPKSGLDWSSSNTAGLPDPSEAGRMFHDRHPKTPWVWKDPRLALTLPYWRRSIDEPVSALVMLRDPIAVATSLQIRDGFPLALGVALWERYNRLIAADSAGLPLWVSTYDELMADPDAWVKVAREHLASLGIHIGESVPTEHVVAAVRPELQHAEANLAQAEREFPTAAALHRSLLECIGFHDRFASPVIPDEQPWVEAELVAGRGARHRRWLRRWQRRRTRSHSVSQPAGSSGLSSQAVVGVDRLAVVHTAKAANDRKRVLIDLPETD
jgi:hypothetical protein